MIRYAAYFLRGALAVLYAPMRLLRRRDKVTLISRQSNTPSVDFQLLVQEFHRQSPTTEVVVLTYEFHTSALRKVGYVGHIFTQMRHIATSRIVIVDTYCIPVSLLRHKRGLTIIQIWHALGSLKRFGYSILDAGEGSSSEIATIMRMHQNYDLVTCSAPACVPAFAEAFNTTAQHVAVNPLPRVDLLANPHYMGEQRRRLHRLFPELAQRPTVLFAPTFQKGQHFAADELHRYFAQRGYNLIAKPHPVALAGSLDTTSVRYAGHSAFELIAAADFLVTDYSSIMLEAAVADVPVFILAPDYEDYQEKRSFYIDFDAEVPSAIAASFDDLLNNLEMWDGDKTRLRRFASQYVSVPSDETCTERLVKTALSA